MCMKNNNQNRPVVPRAKSSFMENTKERRVHFSARLIWRISFISNLFLVHDLYLGPCSTFLSNSLTISFEVIVQSCIRNRSQQRREKDSRELVESRSKSTLGQITIHKRHLSMRKMDGCRYAGIIWVIFFGYSRFIADETRWVYCLGLVPYQTEDERKTIVYVYTV